MFRVVHDLGALGLTPSFFIKQNTAETKESMPFYFRNVVSFDYFQFIQFYFISILFTSV